MAENNTITVGYYHAVIGKKPLLGFPRKSDEVLSSVFSFAVFDQSFGLDVNWQANIIH